MGLLRTTLVTLIRVQKLTLCVFHGLTEGIVLRTEQPAQEFFFQRTMTCFYMAMIVIHCQIDFFIPAIIQQLFHLTLLDFHIGIKPNKRERRRICNFSLRKIYHGLGNIMIKQEERLKFLSQRCF